jgi:16S rRNA (cytosine1402-N4)-methyltransferase
MSSEGLNAAEVINSASADELADIFYYYGEEKAARKVARAIVEARSEKPIERTVQLAEIIRAAIPGKQGKTHPATRSFQGLRIYINKEFDAIESGLAASETLLGNHGRLVVVSFHSLEDRKVKWAFRDEAHWEIVTRKPVEADEAETARNPRARSAKFRVAKRRPN